MCANCEKCEFAFSQKSQKSQFAQIDIHGYRFITEGFLGYALNHIVITY